MPTALATEYSLDIEHSDLGKSLGGEMGSNYMKALKVIAAPRDDLDGLEVPVLTPWVGTLTGPVNAGQVALDRIAPGAGVTPGKDVYRVVPSILLWVQ